MLLKDMVKKMKPISSIHICPFQHLKSGYVRHISSFTSKQGDKITMLFEKEPVFR